MFPHIQLISIEFSLNFSWPEELVAMARAIKAFLSVDISQLTQSPECKLPGSDPCKSPAFPLALSTTESAD